jgi:hypothetical protein
MLSLTFSRGNSMVSQKKKNFVFLECFHIHRTLEGEDGIRTSKIKRKGSKNEIINKSCQLFNEAT